MYKTLWDKYVIKGESCYKTTNYQFINDFVNICPENIDIIVSIGCTNGIDFIPFLKKSNKYKFIGMDVMDKNIIEWLYPLSSDNLTYYEINAEFGIEQNSIQKEVNKNTLLDYLNLILNNYNIDNVLVISVGTIQLNTDSDKIFNILFDKFPNILLLEYIKSGDYKNPWNKSQKEYDDDELIKYNINSKSLTFENHPDNLTCTLCIRQKNMNDNIINDYLNNIILPVKLCKMNN